MMGASEGQTNGTQPTVGELHTWVAIELDFGASMTFRLKAVYGQILEGYKWKLT